MVIVVFIFLAIVHVSRDRVMEPKHKVFVSHSGAQKDFVEQLCVDLERVSYKPFFDKRPESLENGVTFPDVIFRVIKECWIAVLILSEDFFTKTKWPMLELAAIVDARKDDARKEDPRPMILPLFLKISPSEYKSEGRRAGWNERWKEWASADRPINLKRWNAALKVVDPINGIHLEGMTEVAYRTNVVQTICRLCPNVMFDDSHVQGKQRLCKIVIDMFDKVNAVAKSEEKLPFSPSIIGVFGMGGLGKTTLCKLMCNHLFSPFVGKVCHIELGVANSLEQQKKALKKLTEASPCLEASITDPDEGFQQLQNMISNHKVFLALDNVTDDQAIIEEVSRYLSLPYGDGSMVLVTSRSCDVLYDLKIWKSFCMEVPNLDETEAIALFLQASKMKTSEYSSLSIKEKNLTRESVMCAQFKSTSTSCSQFHPLALKALGGILVRDVEDPIRWNERLNTLDLKASETRNRTLFSVLRSAYDALAKTERLIFMDVALYKPSSIITVPDVCRWLSCVHQVSVAQLKILLNCLKTKSLIDDGPSCEHVDNEVEMDSSSIMFEGVETMHVPRIAIHELYMEFADMESKREDLQTALCYFCEGGSDVPLPMQKKPANGGCWPVERMALVHRRLHSLGECNLGERFCNVRVLRLEYLTLGALQLEGMTCLASLDIRCCENLQTICGVPSLKNLAWLRVARCVKLEAYPRLEGLPALEHVELRNSKAEAALAISNCAQLGELRLSDIKGVTDFRNIHTLPGLRKMVIEWCPQLKYLLMENQHFPKLQELHVLDCPACDEVLDLRTLTSLQKLHLRGVEIREVVGLSYLRELRELVCQSCPQLDGLGPYQLSTKLEVLDVLTCPRLKDTHSIGALKALQHWGRVLKKHVSKEIILNKILNNIMEDIQIRKHLMSEIFHLETGDTSGVCFNTRLHEVKSLELIASLSTSWSKIETSISGSFDFQLLKYEFMLVAGFDIPKELNRLQSMQRFRSSRDMLHIKETNYTAAVGQAASVALRATISRIVGMATMITHFALLPHIQYVVGRIDGMATEITHFASLPDIQSAVNLQRLRSRSPYKLLSVYQVFLTHDGFKMEFVEELAFDLKSRGYLCFFEQPPDWVAMWEMSQHRRVAVVLLTTKYFSEMPMWELANFVDAQTSWSKLDLKILPLFFDVCRGEIHDSHMTTAWLKEGRVNVQNENWAFEALRAINGLAFNGVMDEVKRGMKVVDAASAFLSNMSEICEGTQQTAGDVKRARRFLS